MILTLLRGDVSNRIFKPCLARISVFGWGYEVLLLRFVEEMSALRHGRNLEKLLGYIEQYAHWCIEETDWKKSVQWRTGGC
ncbi:hypothetical protein MA16_Dca025420 [Dendrobium catenatum]|uniref:Uncharacterized protein n=1 Tax=Dendrobium catenatum TaxID=906689 RepID=A0A2I0XBG1_9ASPA|nr:hypothetical protein MA16_Dca025420 [Dendrobium catenatum]